MRIPPTVFVLMLLYASSAVFYSSLFIFSENQSTGEQVAKIFVSSLYVFVFILPVYLAQSGRALLVVFGYVILLAYFLYILFLTSYFSYFGFIPEVYAFGAANAADMSEVSAHYFKQVFGLREFALIGLAAAFFWILPRCRLSPVASVSLVLPVSLFAFSFFSFGPPGVSGALGNASIVKRFGLPAFVYVSAGEWFGFEAGYLAPETPYPGKVARAAFPGAATSGRIAEVPGGVRKVFLVQIESFDKEVIGAVRNGVQVMPFVNGLRPHCLEYRNFFTTKSVGGSSDSEFAVATGLVPSAKRPSIRHADFGTITTLYDLLKEQGIDSYFSHNNHIGFYGRHIAYPQIEGLDFRFLDLGARLKEREFAIQTMRRALDNSERLFYYFFNFQSHGPYSGFSDETAEKLGIEGRFDIDANYLGSMHEVDGMIEALFEMQKEEFAAGENVFILTADHPSYLNSEANLVSRMNIPLLLCHVGFQGRSVDKIGSTPDLFPTILGLFGIPQPDTSIAQDLLDDGDNIALLPSGIFLQQDAGGSVLPMNCRAFCERFFDYTDQHIRLSE